MKILAAISKLGLVLYVISSLLPISKSDAWWIRVWDFPRLQLLVLGLCFGFAYWAFSKDRKPVQYVLMSALLLGLGLDAYRVLPYSPLWRPQSLQARSAPPDQTLSLVMVNVLQKNTKAQKLISLIQEKSPDVVLLLEVNQRWMEDLSELSKDYQYQVRQPQDNKYGMALFSKLPLVDPQIRFLVEPGIPSISTKLKLPTGADIQLYGLHPRPPIARAGPTTERDAELVMVAKEVRDQSDPVIVAGDLNDVAWSHTNRLFGRISSLLDPRVGRAPYPTFPVQFPFLRFPLDYVFHSKSLRLVEIERLGNVGSDHFPMSVSLSLASAKDLQEAPTLDDGDLREANDTIERTE